MRWNEERNFEAVLDLMGSAAIHCAPLVTHRFDLARAAEAYEMLASDQPLLNILR